MKRWHVIEELIKQCGWTRGVELGVYKGQTFRHLLMHCPGLTLYGVDLFDTGFYHSTRDGRPPKQFDLEREFVILSNWLADTGYDGHLIREETVEASHRFFDASLDFVFVDADHRYESVAADLDAWTPKIRPGSGMVIGHDWNEREFPGVIRAARERFPQVELLAHDHMWIAQL